MKRIITCEICGTQFTTNKPNSKYCGLKCREYARIYNRSVWKKLNPNYQKEYMKEYRKKDNN